METAREVEAMRVRNGFSDKNYAGYKNYLRTELRRCPKDARSLYKLESNMSKFLLLGSVRFLKNSMRILRKQHSEFLDAYTKLTAALISHEAGDPVEIDVLIELREYLLPFKTFVDQIDALIESSSRTFDISSLRAKSMWNDIEVSFSTALEQKTFLESSTAPQGDGYNAVLIRYILKTEKRECQLVALVCAKPCRIICISRKIERLLEALNAMKAFLRSNLVDSAHIDQKIRETAELSGYYSKIRDFVEFVRWDESVNSFAVPSMFRSIETQILKGREEACVSKKHSQRAMLAYLEEAFRPHKATIHIPFIPVIFDIAADYIKYPVEDKKLSELFEKTGMPE